MDTKKLAERLRRLQEKNGGGTGKNIWFKSSSEKQKIRMVPYPHETDGSPFIEVYFHYNIAGQRSLVCPKETYGEPCPICELAEEFRSHGTKDSWQQFKKFAPKLRTYSPVISRADDDPEVKLWGYGKTIYENLMEKFLSEDWGDLSDVKEGHDLTVWTIPKDDPANDTDFDQPKMDVVPKPTPLLAKKADIVKLLESIPDYLNDGETFPVKSYQELQDIIRKLSDAEDDYDDDDDKDSTVAYASEDDEDSSDEEEDSLSDRLSKLLGD